VRLLEKEALLLKRQLLLQVCVCQRALASLLYCASCAHQRLQGGDK
jgi:hypothetical protein